MKQILIIICALAMCIISGCVNNSLEEEGICTDTLYIGRVIYSNGTPVANADIKITNGYVLYGSTKADEDGNFCFSIEAADIDSTYYISISDSIVEKRYEPTGFGKSVYDYQNIIFYNKEEYDEYMQLPTMMFAGLKYHIYPNMGYMTWKQSNTACENFALADYIDWYMPNKEEFQQIYKTNSSLVYGDLYWTSTDANILHREVHYHWDGDGVTIYTDGGAYYFSDERLCNTLAVRHD